MAISVLDSSVTNIALPTIAHDLSSAPASTVWVVTSYQIAIMMMLLPVAALGERFGYLRVYAAGLMVFVAASIACASASTLPMLAACRFLQGLGAAATMGVNGALMRHVWPKRLLGRGIGYNAMVIGCTAAAGPAIAGIILALADWPWLFLVNVPTGVVALAILLKWGPRTTPETRRFDWLDALMSAAMIGSLFYALSDLAHGVRSWRSAVAVVAGCALASIVIPRLRSSPRPLIPFDLLRLAPLRFAYAASICAFASQMSLLVSLPFQLEHSRDLAAHMIGLVILPLPLGVGAISPLAGRFADRPWANRLSAGGLILLAAMLALMALMLTIGAPVWALVPCMFLSGAGFGLFQAPNNNVMLRQGPINRAGAAAGMLAQCRLLGQTIGALIASVALSLAGPQSVLAVVSGAIMALAAAFFAKLRAI